MGMSKQQEHKQRKMVNKIMKIPVSGTVEFYTPTISLDSYPVGGLLDLKFCDRTFKVEILSSKILDGAFGETIEIEYREVLPDVSPMQ